MNGSNRFYCPLKFSTLIAALAALSMFHAECSAQHYHQGRHMPAEHLSQKWEVRYETGLNFHTTIKPYDRKTVFRQADILDSLDAPIYPAWLSYVLNDNNEFLAQDDPRLIQNEDPVFGLFYRSPAFLYELDTDDFYLRVNPILHFEAMPSVEEDGLYFNNLRGLELRGGLDEKLYFYTNILEEQSRFPAHVRDWIRKFRAVPGAGFYKNHSSDIFNEQNGHDYLRASGFLGFSASEHFGLELGHGSHFIGNGMRSLFLSDFSGNYFYLKFNTRVWKLHYQNIFAEISPISALDDEGDQLLPKKYFAAHYLSFKPNEALRFGLFETVVFAREDAFEFQYLNPIILYRTVEQALGSPDNVLLGVDFSVNIKKRLLLYGQFMLDEFALDEIFGGNQWWGNKYGLQAGLQWFDFGGVEGLDARGELNFVRPYTYSHRDSTNASYSHFNQSLAHPLGANFIEYTGRLEYRPNLKWSFEFTARMMEYGEDTDSQYFGMDILRSSDNRVSDTGNEITQGVLHRVYLGEFYASYMLAHNLFIDLHAAYRTVSEPANVADVGFAGIGIRMNIGRQRLPF